jgi:hypothetical protein
MCKKTGTNVVWTGDRRERRVTFACDKHLGAAVLAALLRRRSGPVKVAIASCDDAPCEHVREAS